MLVDGLAGSAGGYERFHVPHPRLLQRIDLRACLTCFLFGLLGAGIGNSGHPAKVEGHDQQDDRQRPEDRGDGLPELGEHQNFLA